MLHFIIIYEIDELSDRSDDLGKLNSAYRKGMYVVKAIVDRTSSEIMIAPP